MITVMAYPTDYSIFSEFVFDCQKIATNASISLAQLVKLNPGLDCNNLTIGQVLCLSSAATPAPTSTPTLLPGCSAMYTVKTGDYCYGVSVDGIF
jgi:LysM repeat protein